MYLKHNKQCEKIFPKTSFNFFLNFSPDKENTEAPPPYPRKVLIKYNCSIRKKTTKQNTEFSGKENREKEITFAATKDFVNRLFPPK